MNQETGRGWTSPYLRGFTSQRTVLMVDGIRLNNAFLREGPNQYWSLVDPFFFENTEVMMGPASILYGSDAVGGVVNAKSTSLTRGKKLSSWQYLGGKTLFQYSSAEDSYSEYLDSEFMFSNKLSLKIGLTKQNFGELVSGGGVHNENTNYDTYGGNLCGRYWFNNDESIYFGYDNYNINDLERTQKTIYYESWRGEGADGDDLARTYDFEHQLAFLRYEKENGSVFLTGLELGVYYRYLNEYYFRVRNDARFDKTDTAIDTFGLNLRMQIDSKFGLWTYGVTFLERLPAPGILVLMRMVR